MNPNNCPNCNTPYDKDAQISSISSPLFFGMCKKCQLWSEMVNHPDGSFTIYLMNNRPAALVLDVIQGRLAGMDLPAAAIYTRNSITDNIELFVKEVGIDPMLAQAWLYGKGFKDYAKKEYSMLSTAAIINDYTKMLPSPQTPDPNE